MVDFSDSRMVSFGYGEWVTYFEGNAQRRLSIDFSEERPLPEQVKRLVFPSIRAFQRGEGSDGRFLLRTVDGYVRASGQAEYRRAMQLFVAEENRHSAYLKAYMEQHGIRACRASILDALFRRLRHLGGIKCEVTVLVTAEMIALTYYDALSRCTDSRALREICRRMLEDEVPHVMFQSYTLGRLGPGRADRFVRTVLMNGTLLLVWGAFHGVYRAGGYSFSRFTRENNGYLRQSIALAGKPRPSRWTKSEGRAFPC